MLRLTPPVTAISMKAFEDTILQSGDKQYLVTPNETISVLLPSLHRDPAVYGENVGLFYVDTPHSLLICFLLRPMNLNQKECWTRSLRSYLYVLSHICLAFNFHTRLEKRVEALWKWCPCLYWTVGYFYLVSYYAFVDNPLGPWRGKRLL